MADDAFAAAEKRGYSKGYAAGKRRVGREVEVERMERARTAREDAFFRQAFAAALPACITAQGWKSGDEPINSLAGRTKLAQDFAVEAVRLARLQGRI
jgi:hypothetical protein